MDSESLSVTIRHAFPDDRLSLLRLAALDSAEVPSEPMLVAEVDGDLLAALSLHDHTVIADPFHRTVALVELLRARAAQLGGAAGQGWPKRPGATATRGISARRAYG